MDPVVIYTEDETGRYRWTSVPVSLVGRELNAAESVDLFVGAPCLICNAPATAKSLMTSRPDGGEEKINVMYTCVEHTGQWWMDKLDQGFLWKSN